MEGLNTIDWTTAPPMALMAISLIVCMVFMWRMMLVTKDMQANALKTGTDAVGKALDAFRETQSESRVFYTGKLEDMRSGMRVLEGRVQDLEDQIEDKNHRIEDLERENKRKDMRITELEHKNADLEEEVGILRKRLDEKSKPRTRTGKAKADVVGGGARISGDK